MRNKPQPSAPVSALDVRRTAVNIIKAKPNSEQFSDLQRVTLQGFHIYVMEVVEAEG